MFETRAMGLEHLFRQASVTSARGQARQDPVQQRHPEPIPLAGEDRLGTPQPSPE